MKINRNSRTAKSLKNSSIALVMYFINLILQFFSRKVFLDYLGAEVLGLNTTATNLLQFLNLAELGIGSAVGFSLYKPFYDNDTQTINEIVSLQGKLYRRIAYFVIAGAVVLMCFFPWIFAKTSLPLWYAYASFGVLLFSSLLSYFVNYKQILLSADQKEYKIQYGYKFPLLVKIIVQILAIRFLPNGYIWWLILEVGFAAIASIVLWQVVKRTFPFVQTSTLSLKELNAKHPAIQTKIKQLFVHKVSGFVLNQMSPLIIYAFSSLTLVAIYGNYMLIVLGLMSLAGALSNGQTASIGNLMAEGNKERIMSVFDELFSIRFFIAIIICFGVLILGQPFITLWIGKEYLLPTSTLVIITGILFIQLSRQTVESYVYANGFYSDVWAPIVEAALNIGLSILLGKYYGLNGILCGVLISLIVVILIWKPIFLFYINLKWGMSQYVFIYIKHIIIGLLAVGISYQIVQHIAIDFSESYNKLIVYGCLYLTVFALFLMFIFLLTGCGLKKSFLRFIHKRK